MAKHVSTHSSPRELWADDNTAFSCPVQDKVNGPDSYPGGKRGPQNHQKSGDVAGADLFHFPIRAAEQSHSIKWRGGGGLQSKCVYLL